MMKRYNEVLGVFHVILCSLACIVFESILVYIRKYVWVYLGICLAYLRVYWENFGIYWKYFDAYWVYFGVC